VEQHSYSKAGIYTVELMVKDENGLANVIREVRDIRISNRLPEIAMKLSTEDTLTLSPVELDILEAYDPDGRITNLSVEWGDANTSYIEPDLPSFHTLKTTIRHNFSDDGIYQVRLKAVDDDGGRRTVIRGVTIHNRPPVCVITVPDRVYLNDEIILDASQSSDLDGGIVEYLWSFEDGRRMYGANISVSFSTGGINTVTLSITDSDGEKSQLYRDIFVHPEEMVGKEGKDISLSPIYIAGLLSVVFIIVASVIITIRKSASKRRMEEHQALSKSPGSHRKKVHRISIRKTIIRKKIKKMNHPDEADDS